VCVNPSKINAFLLLRKLLNLGLWKKLIHTKGSLSIEIVKEQQYT